MRKIDVLAAVLVIVGALNWGLVAVAHFDLVAVLFGMRFGETSTISSAVYALVGLAGIYQGVFWKAIQRRWQGQLELARARQERPGIAMGSLHVRKTTCLVG